VHLHFISSGKEAIQFGDEKCTDFSERDLKVSAKLPTIRRHGLQWVRRQLAR